MKRSEVILVGTALAFGAFVAVQASRGARRRAAPAAASDSAAGPATLHTREGDLVRVRQSSLPPPGARDYAEIDRDLASGRDVTYMDEILAERGGNVARWVDRRDDPITVWIQRAPRVRDFWPDYPDRVRDAFYTWSNAGIPVRFLFTDDSAAAEVHVRWVDHFPDLTAGKTYWARDVNWWILGADIELALHASSGEAYDRLAVHAIALHEVGHLIGLDHSSNPDNIMSPRVHAMHLSPADLRTANLIYRLPPGSVRDTTKQ
ncbi:MAG TPA: matrixin family metalloprotease [Gemmatimonadaceae bacterium]|nr:matrixin family metalloprotease [Gemmatimonadaceae bacterium]